LFHMGLKAPPARLTPSDALNQRDWRIYHAPAQRLIARARALYAQDPSLLEVSRAPPTQLPGPVAQRKPRSLRSWRYRACRCLGLAVHGVGQTCSISSHGRRP
jgi:hypothetical protein